MKIKHLLLSCLIFSTAAAASETAGIKTIEADLIGKPPSGQYGVVIEHDASLATHTIYRPAKLGAIKHPVNSGLLEPNAAIFASLHSSVLIVTGGPRDVAHPNGLRDFETMPATIPVLHAVRPAIGHHGTYSEDNGGPFGEVAVAWIKWQLLGDQSQACKGMFVGDRCSLCVDADWKVQQREIK